MDLTFHTEQATLNIRVAVILKGDDGYIFCQSKEGFLYPVGGRVKINESSLEAAHREVQEELGYDMKVIKLCSVLENFFTHQDTLVHEYCFIYICEDTVSIPLPEFFVHLSKEEIAEKDVRPILIKEIIEHPPHDIIHMISK